MNNREETKNKYKKLIEEALEDLKDSKKRYKQIPNILTALRLLSPLVIIPTAITGNIPLTIGLAAGFGLTDLADGVIARKCNLQSELGAKLDAITDKVFVGTLLLAGAVFNPTLLINIGLESLIAGININKELKRYETESTKEGKIKTWFLFALAGASLIAPVLNITNIMVPLEALTALMQVLTIKSYRKKYNELESSSQGEDKREESVQPDFSDSTNETYEKEYKKVSDKVTESTSVKGTREQIEELKKIRDELQQLEKKPSEKAKVYEKK